MRGPIEAKTLLRHSCFICFWHGSQSDWLYCRKGCSTSCSCKKKYILACIFNALSWCLMFLFFFWVSHCDFGLSTFPDRSLWLYGILVLDTSPNSSSIQCSTACSTVTEFEAGVRRDILLATRVPFGGIWLFWIIIGDILWLVKHRGFEKKLSNRLREIDK